jgi:hypothetical protein
MDELRPSPRRAAMMRVRCRSLAIESEPHAPLFDEEDLARLRTGELLRVASELARQGTVTLPALVERLADEDSRRLVSELAVTDVPAEQLSAEECVRELKRQPLVARMDEIQRQLARASGEAQDALLAEKIRLRRQMAGQ